LGSPVFPKTKNSFKNKLQIFKISKIQYSTSKAFFLFYIDFILSSLLENDKFAPFLLLVMIDRTIEDCFLDQNLREENSSFFSRINKPKQMTSSKALYVLLEK